MSRSKGKKKATGNGRNGSRHKSHEWRTLMRKKAEQGKAARKRQRDREKSRATEIHL